MLVNLTDILRWTGPWHLGYDRKESRHEAESSRIVWRGIVASTNLAPDGLSPQPIVTSSAHDLEDVYASICDTGHNGAPVMRELHLADFYSPRTGRRDADEHCRST